ncbi:MAG: hypothetical protein ABIS45_07325 [Burkholderiales bacterium]
MTIISGVRVVDWHMITLEPAEIAAGALENIRADFARFFLLHDPAADTAIFTRRAKWGSCEVFFSPACAMYTEFIFERHKARRSRAPALLGTTLFVGYPAAVSFLLGKSRDVASFREMLKKPQLEAAVGTQIAFLRLKPAIEL